MSTGSLPAGLSLNTSTGAITGTPTGSGASAFTIAALDSLGDTGSRSYTVNIGTNSLTINPATLPAGTKALAYSQSLSATGGSGPYTYALSSGALPAGLALNTTTGAITGTPTANGLANFTVRVTDGNGDAGTRAYALNIGSNSLAINPTTLPAAVQGSLYSQIVTATGGTGPYTYAIIAGALPPGLMFNTATGLISGTPTGIGTFSVTIQAQDSVGDISSRAYAAFQVRPNPATDPDVQGIVSAQAASARRFASTQVTNLTGHMEDLHNAFDPCLVNINFGASIYNPMSAMPQQPNVNPAMPGGNLPPACVGQGTLPIPLAFWTAGTVQFGSTSCVWLGQSVHHRRADGRRRWTPRQLGDRGHRVRVRFGPHQYRHGRHRDQLAQLRRHVLCKLSAVRRLVPRCGGRIRLAELPKHPLQLFRYVPLQRRARRLGVVCLAHRKHRHSQRRHEGFALCAR